MRAFLVAAALVATALAGCIQNDDLVEPGSVDDVPAPTTTLRRPMAPEHDFSRAIVNAHDHNDRGLHDGSFNLHLVGYSDLTEKLDPHVSPSGFTEVAVWGDYAVVASMEGNRALTIVDLSDKAAPKVLSHFYSWGENWDIRWSSDGNYIFMGCQGGTPGGAFTSLTGVGACMSENGATPESTYASGIMAIDVKDKSAPRRVAFTPSTPVHNLHAINLDEDTILVGNNRVDLFVFDASENEFVKGPIRVPGVHDLHFQKQEDGRVFMFTGTDRLTVYDVTDPENVETLGFYDGSGSETGWHEQTPSPVAIAGRHVTIGAGESGAGLPGGIAIFDTTDPAAIGLLGTWIMPGGPFTPQGSYMFSEHNVDISKTGQACIGMYHGGVWVFDISTEERLREPVTLGYYQPAKPLPSRSVPQVTPYGVFAASPYVWGCAWTDDGHLVTADMNTGLYVLHPGYFDEQPAAAGHQH